MKQQIATKISEAFIAWRDADSVALYELPITSKVMDTEEEIRKLVEEQATVKAKGKHLGLRISFVVAKRNHWLDTRVSILIKALSEIAYKNSKLLDYIETVRVKADTSKDEYIAIEILEVIAKRNIWI